MVKENLHEIMNGVTDNGDIMHNYPCFLGDDGDTLTIIDNHHIKDIDKKAVDFYKKQFKLVKNRQGFRLRRIDIYFDLKTPEPESVNNNYEKVQTAIQRFDDISFNQVLCVFNFANIDFRVGTKTKSQRRKDEKEYNQLKDIMNIGKNTSLNNLLYFMHELNDIGIEVRLKPYNSNSKQYYFHPPFHGRYWLGNRIGYIVDGSLNTFGKDMILAQIMDSENYEIITKFYEDKITTSNREFSNNNEPMIITTELIEIIKIRLSQVV